MKMGKLLLVKAFLAAVSFFSANTSKTASLEGIILEVSDENVFVNCKRIITAKGYDKYYNPVSIEMDDITFSISGVSRRNC